MQALGLARVPLRRTYFLSHSKTITLGLRPRSTVSPRGPGFQKDGVAKSGGLGRNKAGSRDDNLRLNLRRLQRGETVSGLEKREREEEVEVEDVLDEDDYEDLELIQALSDQDPATSQARRAQLLSGMTSEERKLLKRAVEEHDQNRTALFGATKGEPSIDTSFLDPPRSKDVALLNIPALRRHRPYLEHLNKCLAQVQQGEVNATTRKELWRWYSRCKQNLPPFFFLVPQRVWETLWGSQFNVPESNPDRWAHLKILAEDIIAAGHELTNEQKLAYIEALHFINERVKAVEVWGNEVISVGMDDKDFEEFWDLGVRMFAAQGDPERAQKTAYMLLGSKGEKSLRVLLPVIASWIDQGGKLGFQNAWALYMVMKDRLGLKMTMEDYDMVSLSFLRAGKKDLALAVFRDMMLTGQASDFDSVILYKKAMGIVGGLQAISNSMEEINRISLDAMAVLPRQYQNKFFFGSWIKRLIGMDEVDAAAMVAELMYERGITPAPKHMNGIIGAWIRRGDEKALKNAESLAWAMIAERKRVVVERQAVKRAELDQQLTRQGQSEGNGERSAEAEDEDDSVAHNLPPFTPPPYSHGPVPPATTETFNVLLLYYSQRDRYDRVELVRRTLHQVALPQDVDFLNQMLYTTMRTRGLGVLWRRFSRAKALLERKKSAPKPNVESYQCLWDAMVVKLDRKPKGADGDFPMGPRALFADMAIWWRGLTEKERLVQIDMFSKGLYDQIIRSFGTGENVDHIGVLIAMHTLTQMFKIFPDEATARVIILQLSEAKEKVKASSTAALKELRRRPAVRAQHAQQWVVTEILDKLQNRRLEFLESKGAQLDEESDTAMGEEKLLLMSELLKTIIIEEVRVTNEDMDSSIMQAAWEMEVPWVNIGDKSGHFATPQ
ncbi:MAG: hypothetical protein M1824_004767 [Vezdaea acicularis]|nr:MAG: hypothetical protein M1824_004767 [Vezdaea acicularis]